MRDAAALPESELDRLKDELERLEAEVARLRQERQEDRAALRHAERQLVAKTNELATIHASRSWKAARMLAAATAFRRRIAFARPTASRAPVAAPVATATAVTAAPVQPLAEITTCEPQVSLVVLPGGAPSRAVQLDRLRGTWAGCSYEVLTPRQGTAEADLPGSRSFAVADAASAVEIANAGAAAAQGERIVFWQPASLPQPGWLVALDQCLATFEQAGMAGAVLLRPDGLIACAGLAVAGDGGLQWLGAGEDPRHPAFASVEPVDALPLGAIMLARTVWQRLGGLDPELAAIDHAFAELAHRLRRAGLLALRQPFARLTGEPWRDGDTWNAAYGRWRQRRTEQANHTGMARLGLPRRMAPRVLFFDHFVPTPDRDAGSVVITWFMRIFVEFGYEVTLLPINDTARGDHYVDDLRRQGIRVVANGWLAEGEHYLAREPAPFDLIIVYRGSLVAKEMLDLLQWHSPQARLVFNTVDLHFLRMEREALLTRSAVRLEEAFRMQQTELAAMVRADCTILLSQAEQQLVRGLLPRARTCVIPLVTEISGRQRPFAARHGVLFVGSFSHRPNVDAVLSFVRDVWPLVRARLATTLNIIGADPPGEVRAAVSGADGVTLPGFVADLGSALAACRLTIAPLRFGAGIKGKIVSSIAAGVPCVASPLAVEGMGLADQVRVAATPQDFADAVIEVHEREDLWQRMSDAGLEFAQQTYSVASARRRIGALLAELNLPAGEAATPGRDT
jgi:glycosyltransferase involved in cell wall biosynthesis